MVEGRGNERRDGDGERRMRKEEKGGERRERREEGVLVISRKDHVGLNGGNGNNRIEKVIPRVLEIPKVIVRICDVT